MSKKKVSSSHPFGALSALKEKLVREEEAKQKARAQGGSAPKAKSPTIPKPTKPTSREASMTFADFMGGPTPRKDDPRIPKRPEPTEPSVLVRENEETRARLRELALGGARFEVRDDGVYLEGARLGTDAAHVRALRRGQIPVDARLDLHGLTSDEAKTALGTFLQEQRNRGERCVKIIHGKGSHSPGGQSILRGELSAWLSQGSGAEHVAAFSSQRTDDDAPTAVLVLLRRRGGSAHTNT